MSRFSRRKFLLTSTDGGLLDHPHPGKEAFLAPGERPDVLLDLSGATVGDTVTLRNLAFDPMHAEDSMAGMARPDGEIS